MTLLEHFTEWMGTATLFPATAYLAAVSVPLALGDVLRRRLANRLVLPGLVLAGAGAGLEVLGRLGARFGWAASEGETASSGQPIDVPGVLLRTWLVAGTGPESFVEAARSGVAALALAAFLIGGALFSDTPPWGMGDAKLLSLCALALVPRPPETLLVLLGIAGLSGACWIMVQRVWLRCGAGTPPSIGVSGAARWRRGRERAPPLESTEASIPLGPGILLGFWVSRTLFPVY